MCETTALGTVIYFGQRKQKLLSCFHLNWTFSAILKKICCLFQRIRIKNLISFFPGLKNASYTLMITISYNKISHNKRQEYGIFFKLKFNKSCHSLLKLFHKNTHRYLDCATQLIYRNGCENHQIKTNNY
jgi:hypothetical protein